MFVIISAEKSTLHELAKKKQIFIKILVESEPCVSTHFKGRGAFPSSRLDSHRDFEPDGVVHVDFRRFLTRFVPILPFSIGNRSEIDRKSTGNRPETIRKPSGNHPGDPSGNPKQVKKPGGCRPPDPPQSGGFAAPNPP